MTEHRKELLIRKLRSIAWEIETTQRRYAPEIDEDGRIESDVREAKDRLGDALRLLEN